MRKVLFLFCLSVTLFASYGQNVGIGITSPTDRLHINSAIGQNPFRIQVNGSTKFRVWENGGSGIGTLTMPPDNGLLVQGSIQPVNGISTPNKLIIESTSDSLVLTAGTNQIILAPNGTILIRSNTNKITIESPQDLELKGSTIKINATAQLLLNGGIIKMNNGSRPAAGIGHQTSGTSLPGGGPVISTIINGSTTVFIDN